MTTEKPKFIKSQIYLPKCNICGLKFLCKESLDRHKSKLHFKTTYSGKIGKYQCDFDGKFFSSKYKISCHMRDVHLSIRQYKAIHKLTDNKTHKMISEVKNYKYKKCDKCQKTFNKEIKLLKHKKRVHSVNHDEKYKCKICKKGFKLKEYLRQHKSIHEKKFECKICNKKLSKKIQMKYHHEKHHKSHAYEK